MQFFPAFLLKRNTLRGTPHYSILLATAIPIIVLLLVRGNILLLGDMYAFGLLGAFTLTCLGLDIVRHRERKAARTARDHPHPAGEQLANGSDLATASHTADGTPAFTQEHPSPTEHPSTSDPLTEETPPSPYAGGMMLNPWYTFKFYIGLLTTTLVVTAWTTNLVAKPLATAFGGTVTIVGMGIAYFNYARHRREDHVPVAVTQSEEYLPGSTLAVLMPESELNDAVIHSALTHANGKPVVFLYLGSGHPRPTPRLFLYRLQEPHAIEQVWRVVHPHDCVIAAEHASRMQDINPDRIRFEVTPEGKVAHLLKRW